MKIEDAVKERGILFSGPMVRAILEGRKTQTRRPVKGLLKINLPKSVLSDLPFPPIAEAKPGIHPIFMNPHGAISVDTANGRLGIKPGEFEWVTPYGQPGDRLWVRETACIGKDPVTKSPMAIYRADYKVPPIVTGRKINKLWTPSIHMPRWASRITLEITNVRVEKISDISLADINAEGISISKTEFIDFPNALNHFRSSWDTVYPGSWDRNDWVWVIDFKVVN